MKAPRVSTLIIAIQSIMILICLGFLTLVLVGNYCLKIEAKRYASALGFQQATRNFAEGRIWLFEIKKFNSDANESGINRTDGDIESTGKKEGRFEIYSYVVDESFPYGHMEIQQAFVAGYHTQMRQFFDHPNWFDKSGHRIPLNKVSQQTNNLN